MAYIAQKTLELLYPGGAGEERRLPRGTNLVRRCANVSSLTDSFCAQRDVFLTFVFFSNLMKEERRPLFVTHVFVDENGDVLWLHSREATNACLVPRFEPRSRLFFLGSAIAARLGVHPPQHEEL